MVAFANKDCHSSVAYDCGLGQLLDGETRLLSVLPDVLEHLTHPHLKRLVRRTILESQRNRKRLLAMFESMGEAPRRQICRPTLTVSRMVLDAAGRLSAGEESLSSFVRYLRRVQQVRLSEYCVSQSLLGCAGMAEEVAALQDCIEEAHLSRELLTTASNNYLVSNEISTAKPR